MAIDRWDPFGQMLSLREAMDRLFQESLLPAGSALASAARGSFPLDLAETDHSFVVRASLPGVKPEDLQTTVQGETLTIQAERKAEEEQKGQSWILRESRAGTFRRSVTLPGPVNADQATARCENGILILTLPKAEEARPRRIRIGGQAQPESEPPAAAGPEQTRGQPYKDAHGDVVTEQSIESFPASDPPSWTPERV